MIWYRLQDASGWRFTTNNRREAIKMYRAMQRAKDPGRRLVRAEVATVTALGWEVVWPKQQELGW